MTSSIKTGNYEDYDFILNEIVSWISEFGIKVSPTRIGKYRKSFSELLRITRSKDYTNAVERVDEFLNTLYEFHELLEIYKGLQSSQLKGYVAHRLDKLVSGPTFYQNELNGKGKARNYALELLLASKLSQGGIFVPPTNISDAACKVDGRTIVFECKRPQSTTTIEKNIKRACHQLKKRYANSISPLSRGIICLDISKAFNPSFEKLNYTTEKDISQFMGKVVSLFESEHMEALHNIKEKRTIAVLIRFSSLMLPNSDEGRIVYCQQYGLLVLPYASHNDTELVHKMGLLIEK